MTTAPRPAFTVSAEVAEALENAKDLPEEVSSVAQRDIAGADMNPQRGLGSARGTAQALQTGRGRAVNCSFPCRKWNLIGTLDRSAPSP